MIPNLKYITKEEFNQAESAYVIISHDINNTFAFFELKGKKYYIGWPSSKLVKVDFLYITDYEYWLIGIDLQVVAVSAKDGRILFSIGLFSYFKYFKEKDKLTFVIFSELDDIVINKRGFSISETISHQLEF